MSKRNECKMNKNWEMLGDKFERVFIAENSYCRTNKCAKVWFYKKIRQNY